MFVRPVCKKGGEGLGTEWLGRQCGRTGNSDREIRLRLTRYGEQGPGAADCEMAVTSGECYWDRVGRFTP